MIRVTKGTGAIFKFEPGGLKGCAIRRSRGLAVLGVRALVLELPWPSGHVFNGGTWKIPVLPGAPGKVSRRKKYRTFSKIFGGKSGIF
jgi:hypothetical protein